MGKKGNSKAMKKKMTKKEKKQANHLKLIHGKKGQAENSGESFDQKKKAA